ncbi:hypothetical protein LCGC14_2913330 [marine sediment metagenome]|uniref:Uncharacterized protein n=1 Tax=marine sediment metagenome TaxID=412755 RepID=A0A0F8ZYM9_9ZZZZ
MHRNEGEYLDDNFKDLLKETREWQAGLKTSSAPTREELIEELKRYRETVGVMTPSEKKLREALSHAKYLFNEIQCVLDKLTDQGGEDAEKAMQEADLMKDGPSEEDMERLKEILGQHRGHRKYTDTEFPPKRKLDPLP